MIHRLKKKKKSSLVSLAEQLNHFSSLRNLLEIYSSVALEITRK